MDDGGWISRSCKEWRRRRALHLQQAGWKQRDIATVLEVTEGAVSQWLAMAREGGAAALDSRASPGRPPQLTPAQKHLIPDVLWHGAEAYGFRGEFWTCGRVTKVFAEEFGVSYSKSQVFRLLKALGWTPQGPITRAIQRDEAAITRWRSEVWPQIKERAQRERRVLIFVDESGFYLLPGVVKTYAPKGLTPVVYEWQSRDHLSVMGGITLRGKVYTLVRQVALNGLHAVLFLEHWLRAAGKRLRVVWDRSPIPRRHEVQAFLSATGAGSIHLE
jgi:transposase